MTITHVIAGPPGTGKTTWISRQVERAVETYGPDRALVVSLTRAAAREAAGRVQLHRDCVGTLHAHCYRALGRPKLVDPRTVADWSAEYPTWALAAADQVGEDGETLDYGGDEESASRGDKLLAAVERSRHLMTPITDPETRRFALAWADFKRSTERIDFTDMIERAYHELPLPPGSPEFLVADECQDLSNLEVSLLERWSAHVSHFALVGDTNQSIYAWRHSTDRFAHTKPDIVLSLSYRVPRLVQERALRVARASSTYLDAEYRPRDSDGAVQSVGISCLDTEELLQLIAGLSGTTMLLATCGYMLRPLLRAAREAALPFHNPYRATYGPWNPLVPGTERRRTGIDRLGAFLAVGLFLSGATETPPEVWQLQLLWKMLKQSAASKDDPCEGLPEQPTIGEMLAACRRAFRADELGGLLRCSTSWLQSHARAQYKEGLGYPCAVFDARGVDALLSPSLVVGTVHSVKGGEATNVILCPDLSRRGAEDYERPGWAHRDGVLRTAYVGMTRAKERLFILEPSGGEFIGEMT